MLKALTGKVCLVTGGTRGIGRGIALQLADAGATVYVTGRTLKRRVGQTVGSLEDTASEIKSRGGRCVPVVVDHSKDDQVESLFEQINKEQDGRLDILVNNAYAAVNSIVDNIGIPFWEHEAGTWDLVNTVGLRNHYLCTIHAAHLMVPRKQGLIVNVSSIGGLRYLFNVPYGIGKQALDRMAADCAVELRPHNVAMVSLWPGNVQTETIQEKVLDSSFQAGYYQPGMGDMSAQQIQKSFSDTETSEFSGIAIIRLAQDANIMKKSGRILLTGDNHIYYVWHANIMKKSGRVLLTGDLADEYGFKDIDGRSIPSQRSFKSLLTAAGWTRLAVVMPSFLKLPCSALTLAGSKF